MNEPEVIDTSGRQHELEMKCLELLEYGRQAKAQPQVAQDRAKAHSWLQVRL